MFWVRILPGPCISTMDLLIRFFVTYIVRKKLHMKLLHGGKEILLMFGCLINMSEYILKIFLPNMCRCNLSLLVTSNDFFSHGVFKSFNRYILVFNYI